MRCNADHFVAALEYTPPSTMFVNIPIISKLQWHPFTVTSNSNLEPEALSVVVKCEGSWTKKLYDVVSLPSSIDRLEVAIEGPYGPPTTHFLRLVISSYKISFKQMLWSKANVSILRNFDAGMICW